MKQFSTLDSAMRFYNQVIEIELDSDHKDKSYLSDLKLDTLTIK